MIARFRRSGWQLFLRRVAPAVLLLTTLSTAVAGGALFLGLSFWRATLFAASVLLGTGGHAFGHYIAARRHGVGAYPPYFVPALSMWGTSGAYVKMIWPIENRRALLRIFAAGPIAGFAVSAVLLFIGLALSQVVPRQDVSALQFGESLLTLGMQRILFSHMTPTDDLLIHPLGLAAYFGLFFNLWHLFPAGRLDGGRVVYALFGYKRALALSWVTVVGLAILGAIWWGWLAFALFAALTMIRLRRQHPVDISEWRLDGSTVGLVCIVLVILTLTFVPVPLQMVP